MIVADSRYNRHDKRSKLPQWIQQFLSDAYLNLSTYTALQHVKHFLRVMGQPIDQEALQSVLLPLEEIKRLSPQVNNSTGAGQDMLTEATTAVTN